MRHLKTLSLWVVFAGLLFHYGCAAEKKIPPAYEEVLIYQLPYDLVYLRVFEALENVNNEWELEETEKEKGIIRARNMAYSRLDDADKRTATILVKRLGRGQTSVALAPYSNQVLGGKELMKRISQYVSREL